MDLPKLIGIVATALTLAAGCATAPALAETRVALVIGNANYANAPKLANPENDATLMEQTLHRVGFQTVIVQRDLNKSSLESVLKDFARQARGADVALVYYAGHGIEAGGVNYLVPVDAALANSDDIDFEAVPLDLVLSAVSGASRLKLVILDACRNNPFAAHMTNATRAVADRGLARIEPVSDTLVAYAAKAGTTAEDGKDNSPFAKALARDMSTPGLDVRLMFGKVRDDVLAATNKRQEPFVYGSLGGSAFYFVAPANTATAPASVAAADPKAMEKDVWDSVKDSGDPAQLQGYLDQYPSGTFAGIARAKIAALNKSQSQTSQSTPSSNTQVASLAPQSTQPKTYPRVGAQSTRPPPKFRFPLESYTIVEQVTFPGTSYVTTFHYRNFGDEYSATEIGLMNGRPYRWLFISLEPESNTRYDMISGEANFYAFTAEQVNESRTTLDKLATAVAGKSGQQWVAAAMEVYGFSSTGEHETHAGEQCAVYQHIDANGRDLKCFTDDYIPLHKIGYKTDGSVRYEETVTSVTRGDAGPKSDWEIPPDAKFIK
jgi:uncharacterized caspase-like protein